MLFGFSQRFCIGIFLLLTILGLCSWTSIESCCQPGRYAGANNSTLGFGAIYVLTQSPHTWRAQGLLQVGRALGLELHLFNNDSPSDERVHEQAGGTPVEGNGSIRALLGHLALLETIAHSHYETVLILEDDVDTSIYIRDQTETLSQALWNQTIQGTSFDQRAMHPYQESYWDILWLGHCGVEFANNVHVSPYQDHHAMPWSQLTSNFNDYYARTAADDTKHFRVGQQLVLNVAPLATFAYGVTRARAAYLANTLRQEKVHAFDIALHIGCKGHEHRCVATVPELFHHHQVQGEASLLNGGSLGEEAQDMAWYENKHKYTYNIEWSARCNVGRAGQRIGQRYQCLPGRNDTLV